MLRFLNIKIFFLQIVFFTVFAESQTTIENVSGSYSNQNYTSSDFISLNSLSDGERGLDKIELFSTPPYISELSNDSWPQGSWGRGYLPENWTYISSPESEFYKYINETNGNGYYAGSYPLIRESSVFGRAHLHAYLSNGSNGDNEASEDAIDYLLDEQETDGGYRVWSFREGKYEANIDDSHTTGNNTNIYSTSHAVRTLAEFYLSGSSYRSTEVYSAIEEGADWLVERNWQIAGDWNGQEGQNANYHGFAAWALSAAFKVTENCDYLNSVKEICENIVNSQFLDVNSEEDGLWKTGTLDEDGIGGYYYHDTKIFYHFIIIRGLVESYEILPSQDNGIKNQVLESIKRAINHVINHRLNEDTSTGTFSYLFTNQNGTEYTNSEWYLKDDASNIFEPIILLAHNAHFSNDFSVNERQQLINLVNKTAQEFNTTTTDYYGCISYYAHYMDAISNDIKIFEFDQPIQYDVEEIKGTTVSGDFDNDDEIDDIAAFYYYGYGSSKIHVWNSDGGNFNYQGAGGWWQSTSWYDANKIRWRVVAGDFDHDNYVDDIAALYDYNGYTRIHVWLSDGEEFQYQGASGWWYGGYNAMLAEGRVIVGDFDNDTFVDDVAAFYDDNGSTRIHVWKSTGYDFQYGGSPGWWSPSSYYDPNMLTKRVVTGDFDGDSYHDDIAGFYDYGSTTKIHTWLSNGANSFNYSGSSGWWSRGYQASLVTGRVVSGDFDHDNFVNDIVAFYDYGGGLTRAHIWKSTNSNFNYGSSVGWWEGNYYNANKITGRVVSGDFNNDHNTSWPYFFERSDDIAAFYNMGNEETNLHVWLSISNDLDYQSAGGWWRFCSTEETSKSYSIGSDHYQEDSDYLIEVDKDVNIYPNPVEDNFTIESQSKITKIKVVNAAGQLVYSDSNLSQNKVNISSFDFDSGIYIITIFTDNKKMVKKIVK